MLEIKELNFSYGKTNILKDISFSSQNIHKSNRLIITPGSADGKRNTCIFGRDGKRHTAISGLR